MVPQAPLQPVENIEIVTQPVENETLPQAPQQPVENEIVPQAPQQPVMIEEDARSIFLVGTFHPANPNFGAVVKYDLNKLTKDQLPEFECVARLNPGVKLDERYYPSDTLTKDETTVYEFVEMLRYGVDLSEQYHPSYKSTKEETQVSESVAKPNPGVDLSKQYDPSYKLTKEQTRVSKSVAKRYPRVDLSKQDDPIYELTKEETLAFFRIFHLGVEGYQEVMLSEHHRGHNRVVWKACLLSNNTLCLLPVYVYNTSNASHVEDIPLIAHICNITTSAILKSFKVPEATKFSGVVFGLNEFTYFMAYPSGANITLSKQFERCNIKDDPLIFEELVPFPWGKILGSYGNIMGSKDGKILGYAVFTDFVLFNVHPMGLWVYHVYYNKWYKVKNKAKFTDEPNYFQGVGVVIPDGKNNILYALKAYTDDSILLKLSITMANGDFPRGVKFKASLQHKFDLPNRSHSNYETREWDKDILVHLGKHDFCLVRNGLMGEDYDLQLLQLVIFSTLDHKLTVSNILEHRVEICDYSPFKPILGFSLPASESKQIKGTKDALGNQITLNPCIDFKESR